MFSNIQDYIMGILVSLPAILIALSFHEFAHAWAANKMGDPTAKNMGRMTLDPFKHLDPIGFVMLLLVGFGWAKPVMVNPRNYRHPRRDDILVSLAGPVMNFCLAFVSYGLYFFVLLVLKVDNEIVLQIVSSLVVLNVYLCIFNLIPIPPLDGYHVLKSALLGKVRPEFFWKFERYGFIILIVLLLVLRNVGILNSIATVVLNFIRDFYLNVLGIM